MSVHGINGKSGASINPLTDIRNKSTEGATNSALPEGTPLPPIQGGGLIHAASAEIPGDAPGSKVDSTGYQFGNKMQDYEDKQKEIKGAEDALEVMEEYLEGYEADVEKYTDALGKAIEELAEANATLEKLEEAKDDLEKAIKALEEKSNHTEKDKKALEKGKGLLKNINDKIGTATTAGTAMAAVEEAKAKVKAIEETDLPIAKANVNNKEKQIEDQKELIDQLEAEQEALEKFSATGDLDGDGVENQFDPDIDGDGISNAKELSPFDIIIKGQKVTIEGTDPFSIDSDNDGVTDIGELTLNKWGYDFNPMDADSDDDGITDLMEAENIKGKIPVGVLNQIFTKGFGKTDGASGGGGGIDAIDGTSSQWDAPATDTEKVQNNSEQYKIADKSFKVPFSPDNPDKILNLSPYDDDIVFKKDQDDLVIEITTKVPKGDGKFEESKTTWRFEKYFFPGTETPKYKVFLFDKWLDPGLAEGTETWKAEGFDLAKSIVVDGSGKATAGIYLSQGDEASKWGEAYANVSKIGVFEKPFSPIGNAQAQPKVDMSLSYPVMTLTPEDIFSGEGATATEIVEAFTFPTEITGKDGKKVPVNRFEIYVIDKNGEKLKVDQDGNIVDSSGKILVNKNDGKTYENFLSKAKGFVVNGLDANNKVLYQYKVANGTLNGKQVNMAQVITGGQKIKINGKEIPHKLTFQLGGGGQYADFSSIYGQVEAKGGNGDDMILAAYSGKYYGGLGNDMIIAGDGIEDKSGTIVTEKDGTNHIKKIGMTADGDAGNDWVIGGGGEDHLKGGDGYDFLLTGGGGKLTDGLGAAVTLDWLDGGSGEDILVTQEQDAKYDLSGGQGVADWTNASDPSTIKDTEVVAGDLNGFLNYVQDKWLKDSGQKLDDWKKTYKDSQEGADMVGENLENIALNLYLSKKGQMEEKFGLGGDSSNPFIQPTSNSDKKDKEDEEKDQ